MNQGIVPSFGSSFDSGIAARDQACAWDWAEGESTVLNRSPDPMYTLTIVDSTLQVLRASTAATCGSSRGRSPCRLLS
jgi:hypothetical protein